MPLNITTFLKVNFVKNIKRKAVAGCTILISLLFAWFLYLFMTPPKHTDGGIEAKAYIEKRKEQYEAEKNFSSNGNRATQPIMHIGTPTNSRETEVE